MPVGRMGNIPYESPVAAAPDIAAPEANESDIDQILISKVTALPLPAKQALLNILDKMDVGTSPGIEGAINSRLGV